LLIVNVWEHEQGRHDIAEPEMRAARAASGLPQPSFEGFEVVNVRVGKRLAERGAA
jgi:hypothetical protein